MVNSAHPLDPLTAAEIKVAGAAVQSRLEPTYKARFSIITLLEPPKSELLLFNSQQTSVNGGTANETETMPSSPPSRRAQVIFTIPASGVVCEAVVELAAASGGDEDSGEGSMVKGKIISLEELQIGVQPLISPDDCDLAEQIVKADAGVRGLLEQRYGIRDLGERT